MKKDKKDFNFNGKSYDVCFDTDIVSVFVVTDKLSGQPISDFVKAANDLVAVIGFKNFVDKKVEEKDLNVYSLKFIGMFDLVNVRLVNSSIDQDRELFDSRDDLDSFIKECTDYLLADEIEED